MSMNSALPIAAFAAFAVLVPAARAEDCQTVWNTGWTNLTLGASHVSGPEDREVADDFDHAGPIGRVFAEGHGPLNGSYPVDAVTVRFYAWTAAGPGALQVEHVLAAGDPRLRVAAIPETVDITLPQPFAATGKHFVSVQIDFAPSGGSWWPWTGGSTTPQLSHAWIRDNVAGGGWKQYVDILGVPSTRDMSFTLISAPSGASCSEWMEVPAPVPNPDYSILRDIEVIAADDVWAVGHYEQTSGPNTEQLTLAMRYDGTAWSVTPTPSPAPAPGMANDYLWAVEALAPDDVWAAGEQNMQVTGGWVGPQPFALHWDGSAWSEVPTPIPPTSVGAGYAGSSVLEIEAISTNDVWFLGRWVGPYPNTQNTRPAMAMRWNGQQIDLHDTPVLAGSQQIHAADAYSANEIWAVGSMSSPSTPYPYVIRWDGSSWSHVTMPPAGTTPAVADVAVLAPNDVWISCTRIVGTGTDEFLMHYDGTGWTQHAAPTIGPMFARSGSDIWLAGSQAHHWDGSVWRIADGFGCIPGPALAAIDGTANELWGAGRQLSAGLIPLTVRHVGDCNLMTYCTAGTTSHGCVPSISGIGAPSASATSGFTIRVDGVEGQRAGLVFYGASGQIALPWGSGGSSYLCVKAPTQRMSVHNAFGNFLQCDGVLQQDWNAFMASVPGALGNPRAAGQAFDAQGWFRDPPAVKTTNLSNALHFVLEP
jgi:hypothetical protein